MGFRWKAIPPDLDADTAAGIGSWLTENPAAFPTAYASEAGCSPSAKNTVNHAEADVGSFGNVVPVSRQ